MKPTRSVVLAFFPDLVGGPKALRELRQQGIHRSATVQRSESGSIQVQGSRLDRSRVVRIGGMVSAGFVAAFVWSWATAPRPVLIWVIGALSILIGIIAGTFIVRRFRLGVDQHVLEHYQHWVMPGESLVLASIPADQARTVLDLLRREEHGQPAVFITRAPIDATRSLQQPVRRGRLTTDQIKRDATQFAARQRIVQRTRRDRPLWARIRVAEGTISAISIDLAEAARREQSVSVAAEWLLDNAYLIQRNISDVRQNLSRDFFDLLPVDAGETRMGAPRVYVIAERFIGDTDAEVFEQDIVNFLFAYQEISPLTIAELWAMPLMLRIALIESLCARVIEIDRRQHEHEQADLWANRLVNAARRNPDHVMFTLAELARAQPNPSPYVVDHLMSLLQGEPLALDSVRTWLEHKFGEPIADVIQHEQHAHATDQVTLANAIGSLRLLSHLDWRNIFERVSVVDRVLRNDPAAVYPTMDFVTRDRYRKVVEEIARGAKTSEPTIAEAAVAAARVATPDERKGHVGYFLIDDGRREIESEVKFYPSFRLRFRRWMQRQSTLLYLGSIGIVTLGILIVLLLAAGIANATGIELVVLIGLACLALFPASEMAVHVAGFLVTTLLRPEPLPKLSLIGGIPEEWRTLVVVPVLLGTPLSVRDALDLLEIRYLANSDPNLHFALLIDLIDAPGPKLPEDAAILESAMQGTADLNRRYQGSPFSLFFRPRRWSESEQVWMGWERKRGKLEDLNRLLIGHNANDTANNDETDTALQHVGDREQLTNIRFVITLDADTQLPRGAAERMVATLAHPLNRPRLASDGKSVDGGYTIIQPRVSTSLPSATATRFSRVFTDAVGTDPYTRVVSDVYHDLTGEGTYHGKGIYDLQMFHEILNCRFPEASLLSHDLLEGAYVRVGLATDIELFDSFPSTYLAFSRRQHRWIRGDWQIAAWCAPRVPSPNGWVANPLSVMNRWKILDNLRRSLVPAASVALLLVGWSLRPDAALVWSGFILLELFVSPILALITWLSAQPIAALAIWRGWRGWRELSPAWMRAGLAAALLPHQAMVAIDAIARVGYRRLISHRRLLEWQPSQIRSSGVAQGKQQLVWRLGAIALLSSAVFVTLAQIHPAALWAAAPFLVLWTASPVMFAWLGLASERQTSRPLPDADQVMLRQLARQTWRFFDEFVGPQSHWLPPDNYQAALQVEVAQRTSPTNIGLWLLSSLTAHDCGYVTLDDLITRGQGTLETLQRLERCEGHILNWYDTETLEPLFPRYVSTVDSGNLLASLWGTVQGYRDVLDRPLIGAHSLAGLTDTLGFLHEALKAELSADATSGRIDILVATLDSLCAHPTPCFSDVIRRIRAMTDPASELTKTVQDLQPKPHPARRKGAKSVDTPSSKIEHEATYWSCQLEREIRRWLDVVDCYLPWVEPLARQPEETFRALGQEASDWRRHVLAVSPSLRALASAEWIPLITLRESYGQRKDILQSSEDWLAEIVNAASAGHASAGALLQRAERLIAQCDDLANGMSMRFLYDADRRLLSVGFNVETRRLDGSYYDLLASEARTASFVAVARGDIPAEHWSALGRSFGVVGGRRVLLSWSGTMFEYLMPLLVMHSFEHSLLDDACRQAVSVQIDFAARRRVPWGVSEAAFSALDVNRIYQYQAFGVPELGMQRGLEDDLVIAPYASALALAVDPRAAVQNMYRLTQLELRGAYGYFDSIDYTARRQTPGRDGTVAYTYMAHHQGMILIAIGNALYDNIMQTRFHSDLRVRATESILFERIPVAPVLVERTTRNGILPRVITGSTIVTPNRVTTPDAPTPRTQLLGNSTYSVMVTSAGGGYSRWRGIDLSRWHPDTTLDNWGSFCYVKEGDQGIVWSTAHQPVQHATSRYSVTFTADRVEFERHDAGIDTLTEVAVSLEDAAELRRVTLVNHSNRPRSLEVTSYTELALAPHGADLAHPAFSKLFVKTESVPDCNALLAWRKPRASQDHQGWAAQVVALPQSVDSPGQIVQFETDRARFLGRGRTTKNPVALEGALSNTAGWVLDPIFSLRWKVSLAAGQHIQLVFVTCASETRDGVLELVEKYQDLHAADRAFDLTRSLALLEPRQLRISLADIQRFQQLASHMVFPNNRLRAAEKQLRQNRLGQSRLWSYSISGDLPILLVTIDNTSDLASVREVLAAHSYWHLRGFKTDLVILNEESGSYQQPLAQELKKLIEMHVQYTPIDEPGGIFLRSSDQIPSEDLALLFETARVVLIAARGSLTQQLTAPAATRTPPSLLTVRGHPREEPSAPLPFLELPYFNGLGGFTPDGKEYAIYLGPGAQTPAPWVNVIANPDFGALVSESGAGFCWSGNSQSNRLLPWSNDPICDPPGDAIYIRDEDTGIFWSPTPSPIRELDAYRTRHGQGYTIFEHNSHAIEQELVTFVPMNESGGASLRLQRLRLRNQSSRRRRLSVMAYVEWVLGGHRDETQMHVATTWDVESRAIFARNAYHPDASGRIAFASASPRAVSYTADRAEFLGRNGSIAEPAALLRQSLAGRSGAGLDPCAALQVVVEIDPGRDAEVTFFLGQAADAAEARSLLQRFQSASQIEESLQTTKAWWNQLLETIQIETPDLAINFMLNRWLLYQTLSCRIWGRSGFYQSGGAIGFRDQLQDAMALVYASPELARQQILIAAARQFVDGDVQHWWHPQSGAGVRTRISDDLLWLPYVTSQYIRVTADRAILDEVVPFLDGPPLNEHEQERYFVPTISLDHASLCEHCQRAIARGMTTGPRGLPLIGTGDWNDGMNLVGVGGKGESVWLAWFLIDVLQRFAELLEYRGLSQVASTYAAEVERLKAAVEAKAWDGAWYRRAYFDDGTPVGSRDNLEAQIDSIAQSWGVISGTADPERARTAMQSVETLLVRAHERLVLLFTPPFEHSTHDPGYVMAYPPGVRENGGQYTHGAIWVALAFARQGDGDRAVELLRLLNPVEHARTPEETERYRVEPYAVAADVYALDGKVGCGGWTWYTGSSAWMYRVWLEEVLGFKLRGEQLTIDPVVPHDWKTFGIRFRFRSASYAITVENPDAVGSGVLSVYVDGVLVPDSIVALRDDGAEHSVIVRLGRDSDNAGEVIYP